MPVVPATAGYHTSTLLPFDRVRVVTPTGCGPGAVYADAWSARLRVVVGATVVVGAAVVGAAVLGAVGAAVVGELEELLEHAAATPVNALSARNWRREIMATACHASRSTARLCPDRLPEPGGWPLAWQCSAARPLCRATWPSGSGKGLQSPVPGFDSQRRL